MLDTLMPMAALILVGTLWRPLQPMGLDADTTRKSISGLVYLVLLPALVLDVMWQAPLGINSFRIVLMAMAGVMFSITLSILLYRKAWLPADARGALILAASWANVTYLGLPVLEQTFGSEYRTVALHYDIFANTPLLLTVGIWIAQQHGTGGGKQHSAIGEIARVPAFWAAIIAVLLNLGQVEAPEGISRVLNMLGNSVPPLMLLALGMGLRWDVLRWNSLPALLPVILIQLLITPFVIYWASYGVGLEGELRAAVILESAMPTMVL
ncbi:MAG: hypothetical protein HOA22_02730, partial [Gammaproteobacteria bacterium]|nr:hypothetical protein [Gammaproteobacteria bacterium]